MIITRYARRLRRFSIKLSRCVRSRTFLPRIYRAVYGNGSARNCLSRQRAACMRKQRVRPNHCSQMCSGRQISAVDFSSNHRKLFIRVVESRSRARQGFPIRVALIWSFRASLKVCVDSRIDDSEQSESRQTRQTRRLHFRN